MFLLLLLLFVSLPFSSIQHHSTFLFVYIFPNKLWFSAGICGLLQLCWSVISCVLLHATYFFMLVSTPAYCKKKKQPKKPHIHFLHNGRDCICFSAVYGGNFLGIVEVHSGTVLEVMHAHRPQQLCESYSEPIEMFKHIVSSSRCFHNFLKMVAYIAQISVWSILLSHL